MGAPRPAGGHDPAGLPIGHSVRRRRPGRPGRLHRRWRPHLEAGGHRHHTGADRRRLLEHHRLRRRRRGRDADRHHRRRGPVGGGALGQLPGALRAGLPGRRDPASPWVARPPSRPPTDGGTTWTLRSASTAAGPPVKVLLVGDSVGLTLGIGVSADQGQYGVSITNDAILGCGITSGAAGAARGRHLHNGAPVQRHLDPPVAGHLRPGRRPGRPRRGAAGHRALGDGQSDAGTASPACSPAPATRPSTPTSPSSCSRPSRSCPRRAGSCSPPRPTSTRRHRRRAAAHGPRTPRPGSTR